MREEEREEIWCAADEMGEDTKDGEDEDGEGRREAERWLAEVWREIVEDANVDAP